MAQEAGKAIFVAADVLATDARQSITQGAIQGENHVPSRPGEPPNRDTGFLDQNIISRRTGILTAQVTSEAPYSAALELGADLDGDGEQELLERPFMRPAAARTRPIAVRLVTLAVRRAVGRS